MLVNGDPGATSQRRERRRDPRPWPYRRLPHRHARVAGLLTIAVLAAACAVLITGVTVARQDAGHIGVVRNGGPLDDRKIRQILTPGQKVTWTGIYSQSPREYPAARVTLLYTVTSDQRRGARSEVDVVSVPTNDGVQIGLEGTVFFKFVGERHLDLLRRFDQTYGMRRYAVPGTDRRLYPWQGDEGFSAMLDATFRPVLDNDLREETGRFKCADLHASCALVHRLTRAELKQARLTANANIATIQERLTRSLTTHLRETLGGEYFWDVRVRLAKVTLPPSVQQAINEVQAKYVAVNGAKADVRRAGYEARRNEMLAKAYNKSEALARIDAIKAAPKGATIVLPSGDKDSPGINVGGG
jgi:regulator of protease activity HflC (stomatin/prohibitin superfamily)